jgi:hypothetical protein
MVTFRSGILPFASRKEIFPQVPVFQFLKEHADPAVYRVGSIGDTSLECRDGLSSGAVDGYDLALHLARNFLRDFGLPTTGLNLNAAHIVSIGDRRLDLMNLRYCSHDRQQLLLGTCHSAGSFQTGLCRWLGSDSGEHARSPTRKVRACSGGHYRSCPGR